MKVYAVSDTVKKGGGGKKSATKASGRRAKAREERARKEGRWDDIYGEMPF